MNVKPSVLVGVFFTLVLVGCGSDSQDNTTAPPEVGRSTVTIDSSSVATNYSGKPSDIVILDAHEVHCSDHSLVSYDWVLSNSSGNQSLDGTLGSEAKFSSDQSGVYDIVLTMDCGDVSQTLALTVDIVEELTNSKPIADIEGVDDAKVNDIVVLTSDKSIDSDADTLDFYWTLVSKPSGSIAGIDTLSDGSARISIDLAGDYEVNLVVNDGRVDSDPASHTIHAVESSQNLPPVADAGTDQAVALGTQVTLDAGRSLDPEGDSLAFQWRFNTVPATSKFASDVAEDEFDSTSTSPSFEPDVVGQYVLNLTATDNTGEEGLDFVRITVSEDALDTSNIRAVFHQKIASRVSFDASKVICSALDQPVTFLWDELARPSTSSSTLDGYRSGEQSFVADVAGTYSATARVSCGAVVAPVEFVAVITSADENAVPMIDIASPAFARKDDAVVIDASGTIDADNDELSYEWSVLSAPDIDAVEITVGDDGKTASVESSVPGEVVVQLTVQDSATTGTTDGSSARSKTSPSTETNRHEIAITILGSDSNLPPTSNGGGDQSVELGATVLLDGRYSSDDDGDSLSYQWRILSEPIESRLSQEQSSTLATNNSPTLELSPTVAGLYSIGLTVSDGIDHDTDIISVEVTGVDVIADGVQVLVNSKVGSKIEFDAHLAYCENSDIVPSFSWGQLVGPAGTTARIEDVGSSVAQFTPDREGSYSSLLTINCALAGSRSIRFAANVAAGETNSAPIAIADVSRSGFVGASLALDASRSYDADDDDLSYSWSITSAPKGASDVISSASAKTPLFTPSTEGTYVIGLTVSDGLSDSAPTQSIVEVDSAISRSNSIPIADAGSDLNVSLGHVVSLDAQGSSDANGDRLDYDWTLISAPKSSSLPTSIYNTSSGFSRRDDQPSFTPDVAGDYAFKLVVNDGVDYSAPDFVRVTVLGDVIATDRLLTSLHAKVGDVVSLDAHEAICHSSHQAKLEFQWSRLNTPSSSNSTLSDLSSPIAHFSADVPGSYSAQLLLTCGVVAKTIRFDVEVTAATINATPIAIITGLKDGKVGDVLTLDGTASNDPDGDALTYRWRIAKRPQGGDATLVPTTESAAQFTPLSAGEFTIALVVSDGTSDSMATAHIVHVTEAQANAVPIADAGSDLQIKLGEVAHLNGSKSLDPDGDTLSYKWQISSEPSRAAVATTFNADAVSSSASNPSFTPTVAGDYIARLIVSDGEAQSQPDVVRVTVTGLMIDVSGVNTSVHDKVGTALEFDAHNAFCSGSTDSSLSYVWSDFVAPSASMVVPHRVDSSRLQFTPDVEGQYRANVTISCGSAVSKVINFVATVTTPDTNSIPLGRIDGPSSGKVKTIIQLDGSSSTDGDNDPLSYVWELESKPTTSRLVLANNNQAALSFTPDRSGDYIISLVVSDGTATSVKVRKVLSISAPRVNEAPIADAGVDQKVFIGDTVALDGSASRDPEGESLSYRWVVNSSPAGSTLANGFDTGAQRPSFVPTVTGEYVFKLVVSDGRSESLADLVSINVQEITVTRGNIVDQLHVKVGDIVRLDAHDMHCSGLSDANLSYSWSALKTPATSSSALSSKSSPIVEFTADTDGSYHAEVVVFCRGLNRVVVPFQIEATAATVNAAPVASIAAQATAVVGEVINVNGSSSHDADGDALTYNWSVTARPVKSTATISGDQPDTTFTPDIAGEYTLSLVVNDGSVDSQASVAVIQVSSPVKNTVPVADAGKDHSIVVGSSASLDGSASYDADGDALSYRWSVSHAPANALIQTAIANGTSTFDVTSDKPSFTPAVAGVYVFKLEVSDGTDTSVADLVVVDVEPASIDVSRLVTSLHEKLGSSIDFMANEAHCSNASDAKLIYNWGTLTTPTGSSSTIIDRSASQVNFTADKAGLYSSELIITCLGTRATVLFTAEVTAPADNAKPIARITGTSGLEVGMPASLDASNSFDADGDALSYTWQLTSKPTGSTATLSTTSSVNTQLIPDVAGDYEVSLVVNDGAIDSVATSIGVFATPSAANQIPTADAGADHSVVIGKSVTLDGSNSSDPDGDALAYRWALNSEPAGSDMSATLFGQGVTFAISPQPSFTPTHEGTYVFRLEVSDGVETSKPDFVVVHVTPVTIDVSSLATMLHDKVGTTMTFDAHQTTCSDSNNAKLTYSWSDLTKPSGATSTLSSTSSSAVSFTADKEGLYSAELIIHCLTTSATVLFTAEITSPPQNAKPIAVISSLPVTSVGTLVTLDGSSSRDADGDALTYAWKLKSKPSASTIVLNGSTSAIASFTPDVIGVYDVELVVNDGTVNSETVAWGITIAPSTANQAPIANAGSDVHIAIGDSVTLDGSGSSDADGDAITYRWTVNSEPPNSNLSATLNGSGSIAEIAAKPTFTPTHTGDYVFKLVVADGTDESAPDLVVVHVDSVNIDTSQIVTSLQGKVGIEVSLPAYQAHCSSNNDHHLTYSWGSFVKPSASASTLSHTDASIAKFTPDEPGTYSAIATIGCLGVTTTQVKITATITPIHINSAPLADIQAFDSAVQGDAVMLDGRGSSDKDGDALTYNWTLTSKPAGSTATISNASTSIASLNTDLVGDYVVSLVVNDGAASSNAVSHQLNATRRNAAPQANAGPNQTVLIGSVVSLDGAGSSDPDGDAITYKWTLNSEPVGSTMLQSIYVPPSIFDRTEASPSFKPTTAGVYTFKLEVADGSLTSTPVFVAITVTGVQIDTSALVTDLSGKVGDVITLDAHETHCDHNSDPTLSYQWGAISAPNLSKAVLTVDDAPITNFTGDVAGDYAVSVNITCRDFATALVTYIVTVDPLPVNTVPVAKISVSTAPIANPKVQVQPTVIAPSMAAYETGETIYLDASKSTDADNDTLTAKWSLTAIPAGSTAVLSSATDLTTNFAVDIVGTYTVSLMVNDGTADSPAATQSYTVTQANRPPVANAGTDQTVHRGDEVTLNGTSSTDADGDTLTYKWTLNTEPTGSTMATTIYNSGSGFDRTLAEPKFTPTTQGDYVFKLVVNDGQHASAEDLVTITVNAPAVDPLVTSLIAMGVDADDAAHLVANHRADAQAVVNDTNKIFGGAPLSDDRFKDANDPGRTQFGGLLQPTNWEARHKARFRKIWGRISFMVNSPRFQEAFNRQANLLNSNYAGSTVINIGPTTRNNYLFNLMASLPFPANYAEFRRMANEVMTSEANGFQHHQLSFYLSTTRGGTAYGVRPLKLMVERDGMMGDTSADNSVHGWDVNGAAALVMHEITHSLGWMHAGSDPEVGGKPNNIPYFVQILGAYESIDVLHNYCVTSVATCQHRNYAGHPNAILTYYFGDN